ncbi:MAG: hypothetical protein ACM3U1_09905 [Chloroflexota bacterium]
MRVKLILIFALSMLAWACEGGLEPRSGDQRAFIKGKITIRGTRPPADSLKELRAVALRIFPANNLLEQILTGQADFSPSSLPIDKDEFEYVLEIKAPPTEIMYFGIAINYGGPLDWKPGAVYGAVAAGDTTHTSFIIKPGETKRIDLILDFDNLPHNPFVQ